MEDCEYLALITNFVKDLKIFVRLRLKIVLYTVDKEMKK